MTGDSAVTIALQHFQKPLPSIISENPNVPQALENVVIKATAKKLTDRYQSVAEMYVDLSSSLSYERRNEKKLVFDDVAKADTKTLPKISPVPQPAVPAVKPTPPKAEATEVKEETADAVKKVPKKRRLRTRYKVLFPPGLRSDWMRSRSRPTRILVFDLVAGALQALQ